MHSLVQIVCLLGLVAWAQAIYPAGPSYNRRGLTYNLYRQHFNSNQNGAYYNHYHHHRGSKVLRMMCSPDDCVPHEIKEEIKAQWTDTGSKIWNGCLSDKSRCTYETMNEIGMCVFHTMLNTTDITIKNAIDTWEKWSFKAVEDCCSDSITLKMMTCSRHVANNTINNPYGMPRYSQYPTISPLNYRHRRPMTVLS